MYILDTQSKKSLYIQLYEQLRADIEQGRLKPGSMLISGRQMAEMLHVSRNTVELAYGKLLSEGFIISRPRSGYFVEKTRTAEKQAVKEAKILYDFSSRAGCLEGFPLGKWKLCVGKACADENVLLKDPEPFGCFDLRKETANFLHRHRGINCSADDVCIFSGEELCIRAMLKLTGTGNAYALQKNEAIISTDACKCLYIDLFDGENDSRSLYDPQKRKKECAIYIGSFSDILLPGVDLWYLVLPESISAETRDSLLCGTGSMLQKAAALFMADRNWEKYLRGRIKLEKTKAAELTERLKEIPDLNCILKGKYVYINMKPDNEAAMAAEQSGIRFDLVDNGIRLCCSGIKSENIPNAALAFGKFIMAYGTK